MWNPYLTTLRYLRYFYVHSKIDVWFEIIFILWNPYYNSLKIIWNPYFNYFKFLRLFTLKLTFGLKLYSSCCGTRILIHRFNFDVHSLQIFVTSDFIFIFHTHSLQIFVTSDFIFIFLTHSLQIFVTSDFIFIFLAHSLQIFWYSDFPHAFTADFLILRFYFIFHAHSPCFYIPKLTCTLHCKFHVHFKFFMRTVFCSL